MLNLAVSRRTGYSIIGFGAVNLTIDRMRVDGVWVDSSVNRRKLSRTKPGRNGLAGLSAGGRRGIGSVQILLPVARAVIEVPLSNGLRSLTAHEAAGRSAAKLIFPNRQALFLMASKRWKLPNRRR